MNISSRLSPAQRLYLDFVRAIAALLVLFGHAAHYFLANSVLARGNAQGLGVFVFFLISGFLISYSLFQKHDDPRYGFRIYFIDRCCRIYSAFLPALALVLVLDGLVHTAPSYEWARDYNPQTWFGNLFMLQDFPVFQVLRRLGSPDHGWFISSFGSARPFWTISIEWWIYMLFGGVVCLVIRRERPLRWPLVLGLALVAIEPAYYFVGGFDQCLTILWVLGMAASLLMIRMPRLAADHGLTAARLLRVALIVAAGATVAIIGRLFANRFEVTELQLGLFLAALLFSLFFALGFADLRVPAVLTRVVGFVAGYSYSLYLTHHTLLDVLAIALPGHEDSPALFWASIVASNLLAMVFWALFERHHRRLARFLVQHTDPERRILTGTPVLRH